MSRRITQKTEMTNRDLAIQALQAASMTFSEDSDSLRILSGPMASATIHLKTGTITGDSDYGHTEEQFGLLRQHYSEAQVRREFAIAGSMITNRSVDEEGNFVLLFQYNS